MKACDRIRVLCLFLCLFSEASASSPGFFDHFYGRLQNERISLSYFPNSYAGTHRNGIGLNGDLTVWLPLGKLPAGLAAKLDFNGSAYLSNFGMPGRSAQLETGGALMVGWGKPPEFGASKWLPASPYRHTFAKRYTYYFTTDGTSQPYADFSYQVNISNKIFIFRVGNDAYAVKRDGFRSSAGDVTAYINRTDCLLGFSAGFKLWHGDYSDQCYLNRGQVYDFTDIVGGDHTLGLVYVSFRYNAFGISVGYDSDKIRTALQNTVHWIMYNGAVPDVNRGDKIFIELSIFGNHGQY